MINKNYKELLIIKCTVILIIILHNTIHFRKHSILCTMKILVFRTIFLIKIKKVDKINIIFLIINKGSSKLFVKFCTIILIMLITLYRNINVPCVLYIMRMLVLFFFFLFGCNNNMILYGAVPPMWFQMNPKVLAQVKKYPR